MSTEKNVELIRRVVELFNESGVEHPSLADYFAEDIEFREPPEQPAPRTARGLDDVREIFGEFDAAWAEHRSEPQEIRAIAEDTVLMVSVERFRGRDGIELSAPSVNLFTLRDGKIALWRSFWDRDAAFEAANVAQ